VAIELFGLNLNRGSNQPAPLRLDTIIQIPWSRNGPALQRVELRAQLIGAGLLEIIEDRQSLSPVVASGGLIAGGVVSVTEPHERGGLIGALTAGLAQVESAMVVHDRRPVAAEMMEYVAQAVPCVGCGRRVAEVQVEVQRPSTVVECLLVVT
jgi:hypothetical protein